VEASRLLILLSVLSVLSVVESSGEVVKGPRISFDGAEAAAIVSIRGSPFRQRQRDGQQRQRTIRIISPGAEAAGYSLIAECASMLRLALIGCSEGPGYPHWLRNCAGPGYHRPATTGRRRPSSTPTRLTPTSRPTVSTLCCLSMRRRSIAVVIHSRNRYDAQLCQRAALAGKHVLVEGPLASSVSRAEVIAVCARAGCAVDGRSGIIASCPRSGHQSVSRCWPAWRPGLLRIHRWEAPTDKVCSLRARSTWPAAVRSAPARSLCGGLPPTDCRQLASRFSGAGWHSSTTPRLTAG